MPVAPFASFARRCAGLLGLKTLEFAPPFERSEPRIKQAFTAVVDYFALSGSRYSGAISDLLEELRALNPPTEG
jgi:hypothetical protein